MRTLNEIVSEQREHFWMALRQLCKGATQKRVGKILNIHNTQISRWVTGREEISIGAILEYEVEVYTMLYYTSVTNDKKLYNYLGADAEYWKDFVRQRLSRDELLIDTIGTEDEDEEDE